MYLVTGGTGLIGSHLIFSLVKCGHKVKATYRSEKSLAKSKHVFSYYSKKNSEQLFNQITWVQADITDIVSLENAFVDVTYVYHCAALISFDPKQYRQLKKCNVEGTKNIVNLCITHKVKKICYVSSIAALGASSKNEWINEETEWNGKHATVYGITKKNAELEVWRASQEGLSVAIVNPGVVLGPGFWKSGSGTFFYYAAKGKNIALPGGTGFISIHDVITSMTLLMDSTITNERFVLVDENVTYLDIIQRIAKNMGVSPPSKVFGKIQIEVFWRLDWIRANLFKKRRRLPKSMAKSLYKRELYSSEKIKTALGIKFSNLETTIDFCCARFKEEFPKSF
jgi:nucleoside-diphosphate-sugar epimerase